MKTRHDLDEMLARYEEGEARRTPWPPEAEVPEDPLVRRAKVLVHLSGDKVRDSWPTHSRQWTSADRAERREWVRKLYGDQGLAVKRVAELLGDGVSAATVDSDVHELGIGRRTTGQAGLGKDNGRSLKQQERRVEVARLYGAGHSSSEIAKRLDCAQTTVATDIRQLGLAPAVGYSRVTNRQTQQVVDRALEQLAAMAQLVLNQENLPTLAVDEATAKDWDRQCKIVARALSRVRRTVKGEP